MNAAELAYRLVEPVDTDDRWWQRARCHDDAYDPEMWHPEKGGTATPAKRICGHCDVWQACLMDALKTGDEHGVRGGLTPRERRRLSVQAGRIVIAPLADAS